MKIMRRDFKKFVRVVSEIYKKALKVQNLNEVALILMVRKRVSFQDRKNQNTPKFPKNSAFINFKVFCLLLS